MVTLHRASNVDDPENLGQLLTTLCQVSLRLPLVFPVHPRTLQRIQHSHLGDLPTSFPNLIFSEPLGYLDFLCLLANARCVLTDSGGIQAETTILGVPCLTLRWNTEWLETIEETIEQGTNHLVGTDSARILQVLDEILAQEKQTPQRPEGWDGQAGTRIAEIIYQRSQTISNP